MSANGEHTKDYQDDGPYNPVQFVSVAMPIEPAKEASLPPGFEPDPSSVFGRRVITPPAQEEQLPIEGRVGRDMNFEPKLPTGAYQTFPHQDDGHIEGLQMRVHDDQTSKEVRLGVGLSNAERASLGYKALPSEPEFTPGDVDIKELLSCQADFIEEQTRFLQLGVNLRGEEYSQALTLYSKSQGKLLKAQQDVLRQLGVV